MKCGIHVPLIMPNRSAAALHAAYLRFFVSLLMTRGAMFNFYFCFGQL